jgi:hypothetical protein
VTGQLLLARWLARNNHQQLAAVFGFCWAGVPAAAAMHNTRLRPNN